MKPKWKKRLITFGLLAVTVVAFVEFEKWMKRRAEACENGICPVPEGQGLYIDPFPEEIVPKDGSTNQLNKGTDDE